MTPRICRRHFLEDLKSAGFSATQADLAFTTLVKTFEKAIRSDKNILLPQTLKLEARKRRPRMCRNNLKSSKGIPESTCYGERTVYLARLPKHLRH